MRYVILLIANIFSVLTFISCSTFTGNNANVQVPIGNGLIKLKDYNNIVSFINRNDTLFCNTTSGILFYDRVQDQWLIDLKDTINGQGDQNNNFTKATPDFKWPIGYGCTEFIIQHGNWLLASGAYENSIFYKQEIVDTLTKTIYRFPYEMICDFIVDNDIVWIGSCYGISKIETKTLARTDYYLLPACQQLKNVTETPGAVFYLDFHYGLFKYDKATKQVSSIQQINKYAHEDNVKFLNALLRGNCWYVICCPMDKCGYFLQGNACLFVYNCESGEVKKVDTHIKYLETFLPVNDLLVCSGQWQVIYEGGYPEYSGGAMTFNLKNGQLTELTNVPIISLYQG